MEIYNLFVFSEKGNRENNEDCVYPNTQINQTSRLFIVCDGMGGTEGGEIASRLTCDIVSQYFEDNVNPNQDITCIEKHIIKAIEKVHDNIDDLIIENPLLRKMGTTLALLYVHNQGVTIAHIGDSRVYHISEVLFWHTEDHSHVYEMYKAGKIKKQEMETHEDKNILTKVIRGIYERDIPDIKHIQNIEKGNYFLIVSDGVLEGIEEHTMISTILSKDKSNQDKVDFIKKACKNNSNDNYSLVFIEI
jgi:PPM family protein phosphatase